MKRYWDRLTLRERLTMAGGLAAVVLLAVGSYLRHSHSELQQLRRQEQSLRQSYTDTMELASRIRSWQQQGRQQGSLPADFSLFSFLEQLTQEVTGGDKLVYMRPQSGRQEAVELKFTRLEMKQLNTLLGRIRTRSQAVYVSQLRLQRRFDAPHQLDVVAVVTVQGEAS